MQFKYQIDQAFKNATSSIDESDSERLIDNKVRGYLIAVVDKLAAIVPNIFCKQCKDMAFGEIVKPQDFTNINTNTYR